MALAVSDAELQSMYEVIQGTLYKDVARITTSGDVLKYTNAPCTVRSPSTSIEYNQTLERFVYEGSYTLTFPKWVDVDISDKVYILGVELIVKTIEYPKTYQFSKTVVGVFTGFDDTYTTSIVAPYDVIWTTETNNPITTESGEGLII